MSSILFLATMVLAAQPISLPSDPVAYPYDDGSWKKPLHQKAIELEADTVARHNIDGLVPTMVTIIDGEPNFTTSGHADISHSVNWTTHYLEGAIYRWLTTNDPHDYQRAVDAFYAVHRCQDINGVPGLISRGYIYGHGPSYEERRGDGRGQERWYQGKGQYADYRFRAGPSHHNHSGFLRAMGIAWLHFDDPEIRAVIKKDCELVGERVFLQNDMKVIDLDGVQTAHLFGWPPYDVPSTPGLMVAGELKAIATVTGKPAFDRYYHKMVEMMHFREYAHRPVADLVKVLGHKDYDDADHCFSHLDTLRTMEDDEELRLFYRKFADALWEMHKDDKQALFNVTYQAVTGNDGKIEDALWWMKYYPTNKFFQPRLNSIRPDIKDIPKPLPLSERPFDNEYDFKGDPYKLDGWNSRIVTTVKVAQIDPKVMYAADDQGYAYRSFDGGNTWIDCYLGLGGAKVRDILPSPLQLELVVAATDRGLYWSRDCGLTWKHLFGQDAILLEQDLTNPNVAYAVVDNKLYEAVEFDSEHWGLTWRPTGGDGPPLPVSKFHILPDKDSVVFLAQDERNTIWKSHPGATAWENLSRPFGGRFLLASIARSGNTFIAAASGASAVAVSTDGGRTWSPKGSRVYWYGQGGILDGIKIHDVAIDPEDPDVFYVGAYNSFWVSRDKGDTWENDDKGLAVPSMQALTVSPVTGEIYAGTPGGLYVSANMGKSWRRGNLVPMFNGVQLMETASVDYIVAYWMARYHNFITEEQANAPWDSLKE